MNTRKLKPAIVAVLFAFLASCTAPSYIVQSDEAPNMDLTKYNSFAWASSAQSTDGLYTLNDVALKALVKNEIEEELEALGYEEKYSDADLLVNFIVFEEEAEFVGYSPNIDKNNFYYDYWFDFGPQEELGKMRKYNFDKGTLLVQMVDTEKNVVAWQGYASGIMDGNLFDRKPEKIKEAVELIFQKYNARGDMYSARK